MTVSATAGPRPIVLCTDLWVACADTPCRLCATWGSRCGNHQVCAPATPSTCTNTVHQVWAEESQPLGKPRSAARVIHTRDLTSDVKRRLLTCCLAAARMPRTDLSARLPNPVDSAAADSSSK